MRRSSTTAALLAGLLGGGATVVAGEQPTFRRLADDSGDAQAVRSALSGAQRRLASSKCQQVLSDFSDASGHTLRENLEALGQTPESYLDLLVFYDAAGRGNCRDRTTLAVTTPGNRVIFVCAAQFARKRLANRELTEIVLIHEALHSLGLGENPPSTNAITAQVMARCG